MVVLLLALHGALVGNTLVRHNPTIDETGFLLSGLMGWRYGDVTYYYVNPPLVKLLQAIPLLAADLELPYQPWFPSYDHWRAVLDTFLDASHNRYLSWLPFARFVNVLLSLACGWLLYWWSRTLFGAISGLVALALWALCPNVLTWAGVCTVDLGAAFFALAAMAGLRGYLRQPSVALAVWVGVLLGLGQLAKFSLLVLYPVTAVLWLVRWWRGQGTDVAVSPPKWHHLPAMLLVSMLVIQLGYGFQGVGRPIGRLQFKAQILSGAGGAGNRFHNTWLGAAPMPLPSAYLLGFDELKSLADRGRLCYFCGEWRHGGWWYYYVVAAAVKVPLGTWLLSVLALVVACTSCYFRASILEEGLLWLPVLAVLGLISTQTGINAHFRYVLPAFPFVFIGLSRVGKLVQGAWEGSQQPPFARGGAPVLRSMVAGVVLGSLVWNAAVVTRTHPHHLSYFNELAGGPEQGWRWLAESNIDWGQDLLFLKDWLARHPEAAGSVRLAYYGGIGPHLVGVRAPPIPWQEGPQPGWFAVSVNALVGMAFQSRDQQGQRIDYPRDACRFFLRFSPIEKAGYSIFIYHITLDEANAVRHQLGLPALPTDPTEPRGPDGRTPAIPSGIQKRRRNQLRTLTNTTIDYM